MTPKLGVVIVAAGSGTRLGHELPKAFVPLGDRTILEISLDAVLDISEPVQVIVVVPADRVAQARTLVGDAIPVLAGGETRQSSVAVGLGALGPAVEIVLVHDAARPLTPSSVFARVIAEVRSTGDGVIPGVAVADTLKTLEGGFAVATVDRSLLSAVGTPQGFPRTALAEAYAAATTDYTDDAALYSASGHHVRVIDGDARGFKVTTRADLARATALLRPRAGETRTGIGIDVHAYDAAQPLWLGGLFWPNERGLAGHSDGDAAAHAICDALLSAAGLGDIGSRFGTNDPRFENAHGEVFLTATRDLVEAAGFQIGNVSVQIVGQYPRMSARREEVERTLTAILGAPVTVSATTSDGLGFTGRGEGVAAIATALVSR